MTNYEKYFGTQERVAERLLFIDDQLAEACRQKEECAALLEKNKDVPDDWCKACVSEWLGQEAK